MSLKEEEKELESLLKELELSVNSIEEKRMGIAGIMFVIGISYARLSDLYMKIRDNK